MNKSFPPTLVAQPYSSHPHCILPPNRMWLQLPHRCSTNQAQGDSHGFSTQHSPQPWLGSPQLWSGSPQLWSGSPQLWSGSPQLWLGSPQPWLGSPWPWSLHSPQPWSHSPIWYVHNYCNLFDCGELESVFDTCRLDRNEVGLFSSRA